MGMLTFIALGATLIGDAANEAALIFERQKIADTDYESASAFDVDKDGHIDIVSGAYWYPGPSFEEQLPVAEYDRVGDYWDNFSDYPADVNGDGYTDVITGGYFGKTLGWVENPKERGKPWTVHVVAEVGNIERNLVGDIDGDGTVEVMPVTKPVHIFRLADGGLQQFTVQQEGGGGHGAGYGDINMDGNVDLIFAQGWFEAPDDPYAGEWVWHAELALQGGPSVPILVHDVNADGLNDIIYGMGHDYGLLWVEQTKADDGTRTWTPHEIDTTRSQFHDVQLVDIDKDGEVELITGKRYHAHSGKDPGGDDPVGVYYYEINGGDFQRYTIDYGPAGEASGVGIYFWVEDIDCNGWLDIVAPGKEGLFLFKNMGRP